MGESSAVLLIFGKGIMGRIFRVPLLAAVPLLPLLPLFWLVPDFWAHIVAMIYLIILLHLHLSGVLGAVVTVGCPLYLLSYADDKGVLTETEATVIAATWLVACLIVLFLLPTRQGGPD